MCVVRDGVILAQCDFIYPKDGETPEKMQIRFRTLGDLTITGAIESEADELGEITAEVSRHARH